MRADRLPSSRATLSPQRSGIMRWPWWSPRMVISWLDRDPWVAAAFAVPLAIILLGAFAGHPILFLFVPLLGFAALDGMALIAKDYLFRRTSGGSAAVGRHAPMPVSQPL